MLDLGRSLLVLGYRICLFVMLHRMEYRKGDGRRLWLHADDVAPEQAAARLRAALS
jgi:hypothetical protein